MDFKKMNSEAEMGHDAKTDEETMNNVTEMKKDLKIANDRFNKMLNQMKKSGLYDYFVKEMKSRIQADLKKVEDMEKCEKFLPNIDSIIESSSKIRTENHIKSNAEDLNWKLEVDFNDIRTQRKEAYEYINSILINAMNVLFAYKKIKDQYGSDFTYLDMENNEDLSYLKDEITDAEEQLFARTDRIIMGLTKHRCNVTIDQMKESGVYDAFVQDIERRMYEMAQREKEINKIYSEELNSIESRKSIDTKSCEMLDYECAIAEQELDAADLTTEMEYLERDLRYFYQDAFEIVDTYSEKKNKYRTDFDETKDNELRDKLKEFGREEKQVYIQMNQLFVSEESENEKSASEEFIYENTEEQQKNEHRPADVIRMSVWDDKTESHQKGKGDSEKQMNEQKGKSMKDTEPNPDLT